MEDSSVPIEATTFPVVIVGDDDWVYGTLGYASGEWEAWVKEAGKRLIGLDWAMGCCGRVWGSGPKWCKSNCDA